MPPRLGVTRRLNPGNWNSEHVGAFGAVGEMALVSSRGEGGDRHWWIDPCGERWLDRRMFGR